MSEVWAFIVSVIIVMVIYAHFASKRSAKKKQQMRKESIPEISISLKTGINYNIYLSDGRVFENIQIFGSVESTDDTFSFAGYEGLLVLKKKNGKKIYLRRNSIRFIEET